MKETHKRELQQMISIMNELDKMENDMYGSTQEFPEWFEAEEKAAYNQGYAAAHARMDRFVSNILSNISRLQEQERQQTSSRSSSSPSS